MTATYVDASVVLRVVLGQRGAKPDMWHDTEPLFTSSVTLLECLRVVDRFRLLSDLPESEVARRRTDIYRLYGACSVVPVNEALLDRAAMPLPTVLGALDAVHLTTAVMWREHTGDDAVVVTHDRQLARAARSVGFDVVGA